MFDNVNIEESKAALFEFWKQKNKKTEKNTDTITKEEYRKKMKRPRLKDSKERRPRKGRRRRRGNISRLTTELHRTVFETGDADFLPHFCGVYHNCW